MAIPRIGWQPAIKVLGCLGVSLLGCCRLKKAQITADPFGFLGVGPKIRGARSMAEG